MIGNLSFNIGWRNNVGALRLRDYLFFISLINKLILISDVDENWTLLLVTCGGTYRRTLNTPHVISPVTLSDTWCKGHTWSSLYQTFPFALTASCEKSQEYLRCLHCPHTFLNIILIRDSNKLTFRHIERMYYDYPNINVNIVTSGNLSREKNHGFQGRETRLRKN